MKTETEKPLSEYDQKRLSKFLALVLRHKPEEINLRLDREGWAKVDYLICAINDLDALGFHKIIAKKHIDEIVNGDSKGRYKYNDDGTKIRANQGHSLSNIDLKMDIIAPPEFLYHGTSKNSVESIRKEGWISKQSRNHVHLSSDEDTAFKVGIRHAKKEENVIVFKINAAKMHKDGLSFFNI